MEFVKKLLNVDMSFLRSIHWRPIWEMYCWFTWRLLFGLFLMQMVWNYAKPPVTAAVMVVIVLVHFRPGFLHGVLPTLDQVSFNPNLILKHKELKRLLLPAFYHINGIHLISNMISILLVGVKLENQMGSAQYAVMVVFLLGLSHCIQFLLAIILSLNHDRHYHSFSAGFSGVVFGMQVILNSHSSRTSTYGIPSGYRVWGELFVTQIISPGGSFLCHLGGILAGIMYSYMKSYSAPDPCEWIPFVLGVSAVLLYPYLASYYASVVKMVRYLGSMLSWLLRYVVGMVQSRRIWFFGGGNVERRQM